MAIRAATTTDILLKDLNLQYTRGTSPLIAVNLQAINMQIFGILTCPIGSRPFEPEFGSSIPNLLWEPVDLQTAFDIKLEIFNALARWQPRIVIDKSKTSVIPDPENYAFRIQISYTLIIEQITGQALINLRQRQAAR